MNSSNIMGYGNDNLTEMRLTYKKQIPIKTGSSTGEISGATPQNQWELIDRN